MSVVLVTGASTGFGKLTVKTLAQNGHQVAATMREVAGRNLAAAQELAQLPNVKVYELDVTQEESIKKAVEQCVADFGTIDVLFNNAGVFGGGMTEAYSIAQVQAMFDINVYGVLRTTKAVLPLMRKKGTGLLIHVSSMIGMFPFGGAAPYCASKFAVEGISLGLAQELKPTGVESVLVEPGLFPTEIFGKAGINADETQTIASYNGLAEQMQETTNKTLGGLMGKHQPNPQAIANKVLELVNMPQGSRPLRNPVDDISKHIAVECVAAVDAAANKWYGAYFG